MLATERHQAETKKPSVSWAFSRPLRALGVAKASMGSGFILRIPPLHVNQGQTGSSALAIAGTAAGSGTSNAPALSVLIMARWIFVTRSRGN